MEVTGNAVKLASALLRAKGTGSIYEPSRGAVPVRALHILKPQRVWLHSHCAASEGWLARFQHIACQGGYLPTDTDVPTLVVPPPAAIPSLAATVVMNVPTMVLRYRFNVL